MTAARRKVIITCAVTGSVHTPSMSRYLPVTPGQIADQAVEAADAGAAVLHLQARAPEDGRPTTDPEIYERIVGAISGRSAAILSISTGGDLQAALRDRLDYPLRAAPEICSLNMGSMNFAFHRAARGVGHWKHDWERPFVEGSEDLVFRNSLRDLRHALVELGDSRGTRFEFECYDLGHLHTLAHFMEEGLIRPPVFIQCVLGVLGGLSAAPENLFVMRSTADRLFGRGAYEMSVLGTGRHQMPLATMGAVMGGHVRVGLEDSLTLGRGLPATSCAAQVLKLRRILEELSFEIASPAEARAILQTGQAARECAG